MMGAMTRDWVRLGQAVRTAREARGMTQGELADAIGQWTSTIQYLESGRYGRGFSRMPGSAARVAEYFGWPDGATHALLDGEEVDLTPVEEAVEEEREGTAPEGGNGARDSGLTSATRGSLPWRIVDELTDQGELIDATVMDLTPPGSDARMIVVVKGNPNATPEQVRQGL